jgi:hypothetical protein
MPMSEYMTSSTALGGPVGASWVTTGGDWVAVTGLVDREPLATWRVSPLGSSRLSLPDIVPVEVRGFSEWGVRLAGFGVARVYVSVI